MFGSFMLCGYLPLVHPLSQEIVWQLHAMWVPTTGSSFVTGDSVWQLHAMWVPTTGSSFVTGDSLAASCYVGTYHWFLLCHRR